MQLTKTGTTVGEALREAAQTLTAAGCPEPRCDAEALLARALGTKPEGLARADEARLTPEIAEQIEVSVARRAGREPLAYILGRARFAEIELAVDERVLIPRRETELLLEVGAELPRGERVHEVGTGSGAVALALRAARPDLRVTASDLSPQAAEVARENAARLGISLQVTVAEGLPTDLGEVDLVLANLPYLTEEAIGLRSPEIRREPRLAVSGECGADGLGAIRGLLYEAPAGQRLALEHDTHHGPAMRELLGEPRTLRDHEGCERVTVGIAR